MNAGVINHIVLDVADLERAMDFYGEAIGLEAAGQHVFSGGGPSAAFAVGSGERLVLVEVAEPRAEPRGTHIRFAVPIEDWEPIVERLRSRGYRLHDDRKGGLRVVGEAGLNVTDPDGHVIELELHGPTAFEFPPAARGKIIAGRVEDFPVGSVTRIPEGQFFLVHLRDGFLALSQVCTHMQFAVTYQPEHFRFYCPRHRRRFSRTGKYLPRFGAEDTPPLRVYPIEFVDGQVVVDTDVSIPRERQDADRCVPLPEASPAGRA